MRLAEWKSIMIFNAQMGAITVKRADKRILHLIYCCLARLLIVYVYYVPLYVSVCVCVYGLLCVFVCHSRNAIEVFCIG